MQKKLKISKPKVFFNASVILAGLGSRSGASGTILKLLRSHQIQGVISEVVFNEVLKHADKLGITIERASNICTQLFPIILEPPSPKEVNLWGTRTLDSGDAHLLASCKRSGSDYLVSLDKKHILILKDQTKWVKIVSPGELIVLLRDRR